MAMTQIQGRQAPKNITVNGVSYTLKKDATDSTIAFPWSRLTFLNAGCDQISDKAFCCWIMGVIPPTAGSLEKPVSVFSIAFREDRILMAPQMLTPDDMSRMHYYTAEAGNFAHEFVQKFLGVVPAETVKRGEMMPWPGEEVTENDDVGD